MSNLRFPKLSIAALSFAVLTILLFNLSCDKGQRSSNGLPDTQISISKINLSGDDRLNSNVNLNWFGSDADGYITGYEISFDNINWSFTERIDSTFIFAIPPGQDTVDVDFYVRSIDNDNNIDPSPAYLSIPLKNTAPNASFDNEKGPRDTALIVSTFVWSASDPDGDNSLNTVEIKFNNGSWYQVDRSSGIFSFLIDTNTQSGTTTAEVYYDDREQPASQKIDGIIANDFNTLYIRATDIAGAVSEVDTADIFFLKNKKPNVDLLWVSGQGVSTTQKYADILNAIPIAYDQLNYGLDIAGDNMPSYWDPTFKLISQQYKKIFINSGQETFKNRVTSRILTLLEFMGPVMQEFNNNGGKSFITTSFNKELELSEISGPYPVQSLVAPKQGQARIYPDSSLVALIPGAYPDLNSATVQSNIVPIVGTSDSEDYYRGQLTKFSPWQGTDIIGVIRRPDNIWSQVFFGVELHNYNGNPVNLELLFEEILINEF